MGHVPVSGDNPSRKNWGPPYEIYRHREIHHERTRRQIHRVCCPRVVTLGFASVAWADVKSETIDAIKKRDQLICGVDTGIPGFAFQDAAGKWQGLDVAYCRAIAAAVLGDPG